MNEVAKQQNKVAEVQDAMDDLYYAVRELEEFIDSLGGNPAPLPPKGDKSKSPAPSFLDVWKDLPIFLDSRASTIREIKEHLAHIILIP